MCFCVPQLFKLGPVQSVCISEGSEAGKEVTTIIYFVHLHFKDLVSKLFWYRLHVCFFSEFAVSQVGLVFLCTAWLCDLLNCCQIFVLLTLILLNQKLYSRGVTVHFKNEAESGAFHFAFEQSKKELAGEGTVLESTVFYSLSHHMPLL